MFSEEYQAVANAGKNKVNLLEKNPAGYLTSSFLAGLYIALGSILMGIVGGVFTAGNSPATKLACGSVFSVGLCFVIMAGAELFTGNNFVMTAASMKKTVSWGKTIKLWVVCYIGNLIGSVVAAGIFTATGIPASGPIGDFFANAAVAKATGGAMQLFAKGILCNICVCIAIWCSIKMKTETGKLVMAFCGVMTFVTCGFEHSIANMTFLSIGLMNGAAMTIGGFCYNLALVTLGNMVGGIVFVALPYYLISKEK